MNTKYILLVSSLIAIIIAALASIIPIGIYNQAEVSAFLPTLFTPATITFSIWDIIYLTWIAIGVYEILWKSWIKKENVYLLAAAQILSSLWLIPSQSLWIGTSLIVMMWVLYLLLILFFNSRSESREFRAVTDLFLGWIIVACIANIHLMLVSYWIYFIPVILTVISIVLGLIVNLFFIAQYKSYIPAVVLLWASIWIIIWQTNYYIQLAAIFTIFCLVGVLSSLAYNNITSKK